MTAAPPIATVLRHRHLLGLASYDADEIRLILQTAKQFREVLDRPIKRVPSLRGVTVCNLFFEPSTRTRLSFELAEKRLSADVVNFSASGSSVSKGETLKDTAQNIEAMKVDMAVLRHKSPGAAHWLTQCVDVAVINAGDGAHEHPTQALLDCLTISDTIRTRDGGAAREDSYDPFNGLRVSILGDITHSRVARSEVIALTKLGSHVTLCGPPTLLPLFPEELRPPDATGTLRVTNRLDEALDGADIAIALRIQLERQGGGLFPSLREYHDLFGLSLRHLKEHPGLFVMHPGPVNRGVELASEVVDHERAVILNQVTNGVAVRMAALYLLSNPPA